MIQNVLTHMGGIGGYGIVSLCLFFAGFLGVVAWALRRSHAYLDAMRALPLEDEPPPQDQSIPHPGPRHE
jgi:hypothetical protein